MEDINIGQKIKEFRMAKGLSLRDLSEKAGLSPSMVSQIENNTVNPSINTLKGIASVLCVPLFKFFQENVAHEELIVRKGKYKIIGHEGEEVQYKLLTANTNGLLECYLMEIPAGSSSSEIPRGHKGEEVAYVLSGKADIQIDDKIYNLSEGDAVKIPPLIRHRWINVYLEAVKVIFAVTPPEF